MKAWALLMALAAADQDTEAGVRFLSLDAPRLGLTLADPVGDRREITLQARMPSARIRARCQEGALRLFRQEPDAEGRPRLVPAVAAAIPPGGGDFLAVIHGQGDRMGMRLIPDSDGRSGGGTLRFLNLGDRPLGLNFPGARAVVPAGRDFLLRPAVKAEHYGQGQFLLADGREWKVAGSLRWLQLEDVRTLWLVTPDPAQPGHVVFRGIEERIAPGPAVTTPPEAAGVATRKRAAR